MIEILIRWQGPISLGCLEELDNEATDYGIYQVYGEHPVYGPETLLYIGRATQQTFGRRLSQEGWEGCEDFETMSVYVGRLVGDQPKSDDDWSVLIGVAERLLIYAHAPAYNAQCVSTPPPEGLVGYHVLNLGSYRAIAAAVSGARWARPNGWDSGLAPFTDRAVQQSAAADPPRR